MNGFLAIYPVGTKQDWQLQGFGGSRDFGIKHAPVTNLLPFFFDYLLDTTVTTFKAQKVSPKSTRNEVIIDSEVTINTAKITVDVGDFSNRFIYDASTENIGVLQGLWQFYILLSDGNDFISELMYVPNANDVIGILHDFNQDFNGDYLI